MQRPYRLGHDQGFVHQPTEKVEYGGFETCPSGSMPFPTASVASSVHPPANTETS
jgi:hypothetical protein